MANFGKTERRADGSVVYTTIEGDMLDMICFKHYGYENGSVEAVYAANRELAEQGTAFANGLQIVLPYIAQQKQERRIVTLWD